jgi:hypothetical protein
LFYHALFIISIKGVIKYNNNKEMKGLKRCRGWLKHSAASLKVAGSIPDENYGPDLNSAFDRN